MYTQSDFNAIKDIILKDVPGVTEIILFGSYANDTANEKSDMDIMILLDKDFGWKERRDVLNRIYRNTAEKGYLVDFILKNKTRFEYDKTLPTISGKIKNEGKPLWIKA